MIQKILNGNSEHRSEISRPSLNTLLFLSLLLWTLPTGYVYAQPEEDPDEFVIEAESEDDGKYIRKHAPGVLKSDVPLMNESRSVQVIPEKVYRDQQAYNLNDIIRNASNVTGMFTGSQVRDSIAIRGFQISSILIDGMPNLTPAFGFAPREMALFSRVEILKGPSSVTFGAIEPGGALNLVTKKPQGKSHYEVDLSHGRWNNNNAMVDLTGPLNAEKTLLYRAIGVYRSSESFRDEVESERVFFAPSFTWLATPSTSITFYGHYQRDSTVNDWGVPPVRDPYTSAKRSTYEANAPALVQQLYPANELFPHEYRVDENIYTNRFFGNKHNNQARQGQGSAGYLWTTEFGNWLFQHRLVGESASVDEGLTWNTGVQGDNRTTDRSHVDRAYYMGSYNTQFSLSGKIKTGSVTHRPHFGVDYVHAYTKSHVTDFITDAGTADIYLTNSQRALFDNNFVPDLNYFILQDYDRRLNLATLSPLPTEQKLRADTGGIYGRYQVSFGDLVHISTGLRFDTVKGLVRDENYKIRELLFFVPSIASTLYTSPKDRKLRGDFLSPQGGILVRPWKFLSIFANASESYSHDFRSVLSSKDAPRPIRSVGYEGGFKFEFFDEKLSATLTAFEITKTNVVITDPLNALRTLQSGEHVHKGFEFDILATPVHGLNLIASYGYIDAIIAKDDTRDATTNRKILEGKRPQLVPEHNANFWVVYEFQRSFLRGLGLGGGVYYVSSRYGTNSNDLVLPEYTIGQGLVYYKLEGGKLSVTAKNITNQRYVESALSHGVVEGRPFEAIIAFNLKI